MSRRRLRGSRLGLRSRLVVILAVRAMMGCGSARAAGGEGTAGAILARLPFGARSLALGGMHGTLHDAPGMMMANPASLAAAGGMAVEGGYHQSAGETRYGGLAAAYAPQPWLTAGASVTTLGAGELEAWDAIGTKYTADLEEDRAIGAAVAARWGPAAFGIGVRHFASSVVGIATGSALLADVGARVRLELAPPPGWDPDLRRDPNPNGVDLSFAATGLGGRPEFGGAADPGPATFRLGAALESGLGRAGSLLVASLDTPRETARLQGAIGWELRFPFDEVIVAGRAGGRFRKGGGTFAAGLGAQFRGIALDYAFVTADAPFAATHHLTAGFHLEAFNRAMRPDPDRLVPLPAASGTAPGAGSAPVSLPEPAEPAAPTSPPSPASPPEVPQP